MSTAGYVVVEYNQASGQPDLTTASSLYATADEARDERDAQRESTARVGRREQYRVAKVTLLDDED